MSLIEGSYTILYTRQEKLAENHDVIILRDAHNLNTSEDFATIQAAIDALNTSNGHTIMVDLGRYNENVRGYNTIYNNYFNNTNNARNYKGNNTWHIAKTDGTNIIGGSCIGGNYWSDYTGEDSDADGLGDTMLPYNSSIQFFR